MPTNPLPINFHLVDRVEFIRHLSPAEFLHESKLNLAIEGLSLSILVASLIAAYLP